MRFTLNYIVPLSDKVISIDPKLSMEGYEEWLDSMVKTNPDVIFFYTTPTTDIWDDV